MPFSVLPHWRLWAAPLLVAALVGPLTWYVQALRMDNARLAHTSELAQLRADLEAARAAALEAARAREQVFQTQIQEAIHVHQQTLARVRTDSRAARTELERLRNALATPAGGLPPTADTAGSAGNLHPDPARDLLGDCAAAYLDLAQQADGHAADVRLLLDGWPR